MKKSLAVLLSLAMLAGGVSGMTACDAGKPLLDGATLVTFGDSITALSTWPQEVATTLNMHLVNAGIGGNTTDHAAARLERDVLSQDPDFVIISFGSNDFYRRGGAPQVAVDAYKANLLDFVTAVRKSGATPLLMTPPFISESASGGPTLYPEGTVNAALDTYVDAMRALAEEEKVDLIDIHAMCDDGQSVNIFLSADGVHLSAEGDKMYTTTIVDYMTAHFRQDPDAARVEQPTRPTAQEGSWTTSILPENAEEWLVIYPDTIIVTPQENGGVSFANTTGEWPEVHYSPKLPDTVAAPLKSSELNIDIELKAAANILLFFGGSTPTVPTTNEYLSLTTVLKEADPTLRVSGDDIQGGQTIRCSLPLMDIVPLSYMEDDGTVLFSGVKVFVIGTAGKTVTINDLSITHTDS